ncbi:hypothetical protein K7432_008059 [Basidiobolus ranarum]|uniref:Uncharacterized protein n=1 Tax=Basidiobolus ranarum TaxID=34480 RepID=A0ABR2VZD8_9FUNG
MKARYELPFAYLITITFVGQLLGADDGNSNSPSSGTGIKAVDLPKIVPYSQFPEAERPESVFAGRQETNIECLRAVQEAEAKNPILKECYPNTGLFFSPINTVCSSKCFEQSVNASKIIASRCDTNHSAGNSKDMVFTSWSVLEDAKAYCSRDDSLYCIRKIKNFEEVGLKRKKGIAPTEETKEKLCKPCVKELHDMIKRHIADNRFIPRVYYDQPKHVKEIIPEIEELCGDKLKLDMSEEDTDSGQ